MTEVEAQSDASDENAESIEEPSRGATEDSRTSLNPKEDPASNEEEQASKD